MKFFLSANRSSRTIVIMSEEKMMELEGQSDFAVQSRSPYFVDKTLAIQEFWDGPVVQCIMRPPGFGKTSLCSMLKYFFELSTVNRRHMFQKQKISQAGDHYIE